MPRHATPRAFDVAYEGTPSWETGRPQPALQRILDEGCLGHRVLDAGCGTGLHALLLAAHGHEVTGIDVAAGAIGRARARPRAGDRGVSFVVADVFDRQAMAELPGAPFDTVLDIGLFHVLQPSDRAAYAEALAAVTLVSGSGVVVVWSDRNPFGRGPARVRRRDLRDTFRASTGWRVVAVEASELETRLEPGRVHAWLARLRRVDDVRSRGSGPAAAARPHACT